MPIKYDYRPECATVLNPYGISLFTGYSTDRSLPYPACLWSDIFRTRLTIEDLPADYEETLSFIFGELRMLMPIYDNIGKIVRDHYEKDGAPDIVRKTRAVDTAKGYMRRDFFLYMQYGLAEVTRMQSEKSGPYATIDRPACELHFSKLTHEFMRRNNLITIRQLKEMSPEVTQKAQRKVLIEIRDKLADAGL